MLLIAASLSSKATNFTLVIATVDTAYKAFSLSVAVVDSDLVYITRLGSRPTNPTYDTTAAQWNAFVSSVSTYDSSLLALQDSLVIHQTTKRTNELVVLADLGYGSALSNPPSNQWVKVQGSFTTAWIGWAPVYNPSLKVIFVAPTQLFPNY